MKWFLTILMTMTTTTSLLSNPVTGYANYYTRESCQREGTSGTVTTSKAPYNERAMTCALPFRPVKWARKYRVTNLDNGKQVVVAHIDLGPGKRSQARGTVIDLTPAAFAKLGKLAQGKIRVKVEPITTQRRNR